MLLMRASRVASVVAYHLAHVALVVGFTSFIGQIALISVVLATVLVFSGYRWSQPSRSSRPSRTASPSAW
jgi:hypothetical protein